MTVARVTEISSTSPESFEAAIREGVKRAGATLRNLKGAWVKDQNVMIENGEVSEFKVNLLITFELDE
ncbi:MAG: dodecin family protein [Oceanicaulis sp.]